MRSGTFRLLTLFDRNTTRIAASVIAVLAGFLLLLLFIARDSSEDILELRKTETIQFAEIGYNAVRPILYRYTTGAIGRPEALHEVAELVSGLSNLQSAPKNYFFLGQLDGTMLVEPAVPKLEADRGAGPWHGVEAAAIRNLVETARHGGGFATYRFPEPGREGFSEKISYIIPIFELNAFIGTGLYVQDTTVILRQYFGDSLLLLAAVIVGLGMVLFLFIRPILHGYRELVRMFSIVERDPEARPALPRWYRPDMEAGRLLSGFDAMLESVARNRTELQDKARQIAAREEELRRTAAGLKVSEQKYRSLVENMADAVLLIGLDGRPLFLNARAAEITGRPMGELAGMNLLELLEPESRKQAEKMLHNRSADSPRVNRYSVGLRHRNGSIRDVELTTMSVPGDEGKPSCFECIARDATEAHRMERELQRAQRMESIGALAGGIAHDFNNLLAAIEGNLSLARRSAENPAEVWQSLQEAENAADRARRLTMQLLTFSKGGEPVRKPLDLIRVITESVEFALRASRLHLHFEFAEDLCLVDADEDQIGQLFFNLVSHARRTTPEGDPVSIKARNVENPKESALLGPGWYACIAVREGGAPIPPEEAALIFDPFHAALQDSHGLDLPAACSIVRRHKGDMILRSDPESGNTFTIWLPVAASCPPANSKEKTPSGPAAGRKARILVMDDEEMIRRMLGRMLQRLGYQTQAEADGAAAVAAYRTARDGGNPFDIVILDLTVPAGMGGKEAFEELRRIDPAVRGVFSSGYSSDPVMSQYRELGLAGIIAKPYRIEELDALLKSILEGA